MRLADLPSFDVWRFAPDRIRRSYAAKLGVSFLAVIVVIGAIGGAIYLQANAELREDTDRELTTSTTLQAETLSRWLDRMKEETRLLSRSTTIRSRDTDRIRGFLVNEIDEEGRLPPEVVAVHYLDTSEFVIRTSTADPFVGVSPREEGVPWAQGNLAFEGVDDTVVKGPFREPVSDQPVIAVISPVPGQDDRALVMMVNLRKRIESMPRPLEANSFTKVVNSRGTVVMSHRTDQMLTQNMGPADEKAVESAAVNRGLEGEVGTDSMAMHGETMLMGYAPVEGTDWVVMAHVPKRSAFALTRLISRDLLLLLLASVLGLGLIGATVGRSTADALQTLSAKAAAIADGDLEAEIPQSRREDELGRLYGSFGEMQDQVGDLLDDVEAERERAEAARAEAEAFTDHLEATAEEYGEVMAAVADGDLTERMDPDDESEAMREIAASFNSMLEEWTTTVAQVAEFGDEVTASSEKFTTAADEVETASADVSESIQEISEGANRQTESLKDISETVNHLSATIEEVASSADEVAATSRRAAETGEEGREAAEDAVAAMNEIEATTEETVSEVEALDEEMAKIGEIVDVITEIADQTDILALNASIEAARAGEAGDGFAVVADEVKSLAEETKDATDEIEAVLDTIRSRTENTVEGMEEMQTNVSAGLDTVERAIDALEEISDHVEDANRGIQEISTATDDQAESAQEIVPMVEDVAEISEETRDGAEDVAAASEEQAASTAEVARQARELETKARALMDLLDEFELETPTEQPGVDPGAPAGTAQTDGGPADG